MEIIKGTKTRVRITDLPQKCKNCGRLFYIDRDCNRKWAVCPYCGTKH